MVKLSHILVTCTVALLFGCGGKTETASKEDDSTKSEGENETDEDSPTLPVPMGVLDAAFLVDVRTKVGVYASDVGSTEEFTTEELLGASSVLSQSSEVVTDFAAVLEILSNVTKVTFGKDGFFGGKDLELPKTEKDGVAFKIRSDKFPDAPDYAIVSAVGEDPRPYQVRLFSEIADGEYAGHSTFRFGPEKDGKTPTVQVDLYGPPKNGLQRVIVAEIDAAERTAKLTFGPREEVKDKLPRRNALMFKAGDDYAEIWGGRTFVTSNEGEFNPKFGSRMHQLKTDDALLFRFKLLGTGDHVGELAFVPAEEAKDVGKDTVKVFANNRPSRFGRKFITNMLRNETINKACATTGTKFGIAADVCSSNAALTPPALLQSVATTCGGSGSVVLPFYMAPKGEDASVERQIDVCKAHRATVVDQDGVAFFQASEDKVERIAPADASSAMKKAADSFAKDTEFLDLAMLEPVAWPELVKEPASTFENAKASP